MPSRRIGDGNIREYIIACGQPRQRCGFPGIDVVEGRLGRRGAAIIHRCEQVGSENEAGRGKRDTVTVRAFRVGERRRRVVGAQSPKPLEAGRPFKVGSIALTIGVVGAEPEVHVPRIRPGRIADRDNVRGCVGRAKYERRRDDEGS